MATLEMDVPSSSKPVSASFSPRVGIDPSFCGTTSYCCLAFRTYVISTIGVYKHENCVVVWGCSGVESKWGARNVGPHSGCLRRVPAVCLGGGFTCTPLCLCLIFCSVNVIEFSLTKWEYSSMILWFSYIDDGNFLIHLCIWHLAQVSTCLFHEWKFEHHFNLISVSTRNCAFPVLNIKHNPFLRHICHFLIVSWFIASPAYSQDMEDMIYEQENPGL